MKNRFKLKALQLVIATSFVCSVHAQASPLEVDLQANGSNVTFTVTNTGEQVISVLRWDTPLEETLSSDVFNIGQGNINYKGRHIKRATPLAKDFVELAPGQLVSSSVSLNRYYEIIDHANYAVSFDGAVKFAAGVGKRTPMAAKYSAMQSEDMSTGVVSVDLAPVPPTAAAQSAGHLNCSAEQQSQINNALDAAEQLTITARDALTNLAVAERAMSPRYTRWFGSYTAARYAAVQGGMTNAASVMANQVIDFNCDCDEAAFAYVFTNDPFKVYLCQAFWPAFITGTDSKAGTILHELSHFPEVRGTRDHAYGQSAAAALARNEPDQAVSNADSFEYFVENTPNLAIQGDGTGTGTGGTSPTDTYTTLKPGTSRSGSVAINASVLYQSNGASEINLTTNSGDADLYIYSDSARENEICRSLLTEPLDACDLGREQNVYILVDGYGSSSFTIAAVGTPVVTPQTGEDGSAADANTSSGVSSGGGVLWIGVIAMLPAGLRRRRMEADGEIK